jgi:hypothetical protein
MRYSRPDDEYTNPGGPNAGLLGTHPSMTHKSVTHWSQSHDEIKPPSFLFIDESGDFIFGNPAKGSRFYILTAVVTHDPIQGAEALLRLRHEILDRSATTASSEKARDCVYFHCVSDRQATRDSVFNIIRCLQFDACYVTLEKRKAYPTLWHPDKLYQRAFAGLVRGVLRRNSEAKRLHIFPESFKPKQRKEDFLSGLKSALATENVKYRIHFHPSESHHMRQVCDYVCWAIARYVERNDDKSHRIIAPKITMDLDFFRRGMRYYY